MNYWYEYKTNLGPFSGVSGVKFPSQSEALNYAANMLTGLIALGLTVTVYAGQVAVGQFSVEYKK